MDIRQTKKNTRQPKSRNIIATFISQSRAPCGADKFGTQVAIKQKHTISDPRKTHAKRYTVHTDMPRAKLLPRGPPTTIIMTLSAVEISASSLLSCGPAATVAGDRWRRRCLQRARAQWAPNRAAARAAAKCATRRNGGGRRGNTPTADTDVSRTRTRLSNRFFLPKPFRHDGVFPSKKSALQHASANHVNDEASARQADDSRVSRINQKKKIQDP